MSEALKGALIIGQSGGPSSVINSSAYGCIRTALDADCITKVYGAYHGIKGVLNDELLCMDEEDRAELSFDDDAVVVRVLDDLLGDLDVLCEGLGGSVDHDGGEAAVDAGLAGFEVGAVVQMQNDGDIGAANYGSN